MRNEQSNKSKMKAWKTWAVFAAVILVAYFINVEVQTYLGKKALDETNIERLTLDEALQTAKLTNKNVLVEIAAIWCPTCRRLDKEIFSDEQVQQAIASQYVFARLEYESQAGEDFMAKYAVSGFPTLVTLDANGKKLSVLQLTFDPDSFIKQL